ncbi:MAG TPA: heavy metal-associated domain-containing protein [Pseudomonadales bacterium]|nr:heavy metal-associated domain-containing protein [Pseudomonadales bacterium]
MKTLKLIMATTALSFFSLLASAEPTTKTTIFTVNGMVCAFCAQGIEKKLAKLPQTQAVYVSLEEKIVAVEARSGQAVDANLVTAEIKDAGYDVSKVETVDGSVAAIKQSMENKKTAENKK